MTKKLELLPLEGMRAEAALIGVAGINAREGFHIACVGVSANAVLTETFR